MSIERGLYTAGVVAAALFVGVSALHPVNAAANNDLFIHLTTGRLILDEGRVPRTDPYSFTAEGHRWVVHEPLAQVLYATADRVAGMPGVIVVGRLLPGLALLGLLIACLRAAGADRATTLGLTALAIAVARHRLLVRPDLLALVLLAATLWLLLRERALAADGRSSRSLYALVPLQAVWVNVHASFYFGVALTLAFAASAFAVRLRIRRPGAARLASGAAGAVAALAAIAAAGGEPQAFAAPAAGLLALAALGLLSDAARPWIAASAIDASGRPLRLLTVAGLQVLALGLNPHGPGLLLFPFEFTGGDHLVTRAVSEWRPFFETLAQYRSPSYRALMYSTTLLVVAAAFTGAGLAARRRALGPLPLALFFGLGLLPIRHTRWTAVFAVAGVTALAIALAAARRSVDAGTPERREPARLVPALLVGLGVLALLRSLLVLASVEWDPVLWATWLAAAAGSVAALLAPLPRLRPGALPLAAAAALGLAALALGPGVPEVAGHPWKVGLSLRAAPPVPAVAYFDEQGLGGRLCTEYDWAPYVLYVAWPRVRVHIDSRSEVYGEQGLREHLRAQRDPTAARALLEPCELALVRARPVPSTRRKPHSAVLDVLAEDPEWQLLYLDDGSALFGRVAADASLPASLDGLDARGPGVPPAPARGSDATADFRSAFERAPHAGITRLGLARALDARGRRGQARELLADSWLRGIRYPEIARLAADYARADGDLADARLWERRAGGSP